MCYLGLVRSVNSLFEALALVLAWRSVVLAMREHPQGISIAAVALSSAWAVNTVGYYRSHREPLAAWCAGGRALAAAVWVWVALS